MRHIVGCMTGTSLDALDVALVRVQGTGLHLAATPIAFHTVELGSLADTLTHAAQGKPRTAQDLAHTRDALGALHARAIRSILTEQEPATLVAVHGQTIFHQPPHSWQLLNPWPIAAAARCPVVFDLRGGDLALGGQGAPITPLADWILFRSDTSTRAIVNLGGFCNITILPAAGDITSVQGYDACACNHILNTISRTLANLPFDRDGTLAQQGTIDQPLSNDLTSLLRVQHTANRSLGTGDECFDWVRAHADTYDAPALLATTVDAIARTIADASTDADEIFLAGGSTKNTALVRAIQHHSTSPVASLEALGIDPLQREAVAIAVLGALCQDGVSITLPAITGRADFPLLQGCWANTIPATDTLSTTP